MVVHEKTKRKLSYGQIATFAKAPPALPKIDPQKDLKSADKYRLLGKDVARVDTPAKANGTAKYGIDAMVPGMVYATFVRAPVRGSGPTSFNGDEMKKAKGIADVVTLDDGVAIVGGTFEAVAKARKNLKVVWKAGQPGDGFDSDKELETYLAHVRDLGRKGEVWRTKGDAAAAIAGAATTISRAFLSDPVYHAQLEPMNSTASVKGDTAEIWVGTQAPTRTAIDVAKAIGTTPDKVKVHQHLLGGGYGRRAFVEPSVDAARISKAIGKPVKLILLREDDFASGNYRPMTAQKIDVGLDKDGKIVGWRHRVAGEPVADYLYGVGRLKASNNKDLIFINGAEIPHYAVDNQVSEHVFEPERTRVGAWRGIGAGYTKFAVESVIDEIAHERKVDPFAFRLALIANPRAKKVVEKVAEMAEWSRKRNGTALGIALAEYNASLAAGVAEISVDRQSGRIRVHNYWAAADAGLPLQPGNIAAQVEGAIVFGLSAALKERITIANGATKQSNFHEYEVLRMEETPEIKVEVLRGSSNP
ncbi:MAG: xanthine dehydrogenase family protein molybdopterin-binding subunit, partial [Alphaproteobacteria bacterium]